MTILRHSLAARSADVSASNPQDGIHHSLRWVEHEGNERHMADITKTLIVNGVSHTVTCDSATPLLWVLRDVLHLYGTKYGCGVGQCGSCTVHIRGRAAKACQVPVQNAVNGPIVTIEGLSADGSHPLQKAWEELDVPQCGYCQAGQIMSAVALIERNANPTDADIREVMSPNLCRCGTHLRIVAAVKRAAKAMAGKGATR